MPLPSDVEADDGDPAREQELQRQGRARAAPQHEAARHGEALYSTCTSPEDNGHEFAD